MFRDKTCCLAMCSGSSLQEGKVLLECKCNRDQADVRKFQSTFPRAEGLIYFMGIRELTTYEARNNLSRVQEETCNGRK